MSMSSINSVEFMSPAWFSTAILMPASSASLRTHRSTPTVSAIRAAIPPGLLRSSTFPSTQRATGEPIAFAMRRQRRSCSSAEPRRGSNITEVGQMLSMPA